MLIISKSNQVRKTSRDQIEDNLLLFTLLGDNYALLSSSVIQILQTLTITPVANSVPYFVGSTTFRGEVVPVIDLQSFFYGGQLILTTRHSEKQFNYITSEYEGKCIIFRVETVLGSMNKPEESQVTDLVNFADPEENPYFAKAFLSTDSQIIVLLDTNQILGRIINELEEFQSQFIAENQAFLIPKEISEVSDEYNIDLRQKLSVPVPTTADSDLRKTVVGTRKSRNTAILVSVDDLDILIPSNNIIEIFNVQTITKVPNAPKVIVGTINFRGKVISVFDLAEILVPTPNDRNKIETLHQEEVIILEVADQQVAVIVNEFHEIVELLETDLHLAVGSANEKIASYYFQGVMLDRSGHIVLVLNVDFLFEIISNLATLDQKVSQIIFFVNHSNEDFLKGHIKQASLEENSLVLITLSGNTYALKSSSVIEILQTLTITPVANSTHYFVGSTTFRGEVVPVINLKSFFYSEHALNYNNILEEHRNYIVVEYLGNIVIFQVESILGSISMPEELQITNLMNLKNAGEFSFFPTGFIYNDQIIVQLNHKKIIDQIVHELEQVKAQFLVENQALVAPMGLPDGSEELNIQLHRNVSIQRTTTGINPVESIKASQDVTPKGTSVSIGELNILVPNKYISEIFNITRITKVPNAPKAIIGSVNYRGNVIPVLNLAKILTPNSTSFSQVFNEVLILEVKNQYIALYVDRISSIIDIEKTALRPILESADGKIPEHFIQGIMINSADQIYLVLNIEFLFHLATNPSLLEQDSSQLLFFKNPVQEAFLRTHETKREGLLFEEGGYIYFLNSKHVIQVIEKDSFLLKDYPQAAVKGAAIHTDIVPLIDFNTILGEKTNPTSKKSVGILINEPKSNTEFSLLVNNIINKITINDCEIFQNFLGISRKTLPPIISGFFSYQGVLGMIVNPESLFKKIKSVLQKSLSLTDINDFPATLLPEEIEFLEKIKSKRKELELLLFYQHEGTRLDLFVFRSQEYVISIDVTLVRRVFSSLEWENSDTKFHPIIGTAMINDVKYPVIDLSALIFNSQKQTERHQNNFLFLLEIENQTFLVPTTNIEGVVTKFKEELNPCEEIEIFLEGKETCRYMFSDENISSSIYIIENEFLKKCISKKDVKTLLKEVKTELKKRNE